MKYYRKLDKAAVKVDPKERHVAEFVGQHYMEDRFLYKKTRIVIRRELIVGYGSVITEGMQVIKDKTPIHVADLQSMTEKFSQRLLKNLSLMTARPVVLVLRWRTRC